MRIELLDSSIFLFIFNLFIFLIFFHFFLAFLFMFLYINTCLYILMRKRQFPLKADFISAFFGFVDI